MARLAIAAQPNIHILRTRGDICKVTFPAAVWVTYLDLKQNRSTEPLKQGPAKEEGW